MSFFAVRLTRARFVATVLHFEASIYLVDIVELFAPYTLGERHENE
jgi:hypothetical protein